MLLQVKASVDDELRNNLPKLTPEEAAVLALLEARVSRTLKDKLQDSVALLRKSKRNGKIPSKRRNGRNRAASAHQVLHNCSLFWHCTGDCGGDGFQTRPSLTLSRSIDSRPIRAYAFAVTTGGRECRSQEANSTTK